MLEVSLSVGEILIGFVTGFAVAVFAMHYKELKTKADGKRATDEKKR